MNCTLARRLFIKRKSDAIKPPALMHVSFFSCVSHTHICCSSPPSLLHQYKCVLCKLAYLYPPPPFPVTSCSCLSPSQTRFLRLDLLQTPRLSFGEPRLPCPPQQRSVNKLLSTSSLGKLEEEQGVSREAIRLLPLSLNRIDKGEAGHAAELRCSAGEVRRIDVLRRAGASQREEPVTPRSWYLLRWPEGSRVSAQRN